MELSETGNGPIFLDQINCDGSEMTLLECVDNTAPIKAHPCDHINDIGISCQGTYIRIIIHTYVHVYVTLSILHFCTIQTILSIAL